MDKLPFTPLFARVLLSREKKEKIGSIILPDQAQDRYNPEEGVVIAVGHTADEAVGALIGKKVMFAKYSGAWINIQDKEYFLCQDEDILGVVYE